MAPIVRERDDRGRHAMQFGAVAELIVGRGIFTALRRSGGQTSHAVEALLHKSAEGWSSPFPGQTYPVASVMGVPSAVKPLSTASLTWNSAT